MSGILKKRAEVPRKVRKSIIGEHKEQTAYDVISRLKGSFSDVTKEEFYLGLERAFYEMGKLKGADHVRLHLALKARQYYDLARQATEQNAVSENTNTANMLQQILVWLLPKSEQ